MPIFDIKDVSREASLIYYEGLKNITNCPNNNIIEQLNNYEYERPILNFFEAMKEFEIEIKLIDNVKNYYFVNKNGNNKTVVLMIHGGGYILPVSQNNISGAILYSKYNGDCDVLVTDYVVAANGKHIRAVENVFNAYIYLKSRYENVIVAGQSAGGNLALGLLEYLKDKKIEYPKCVVLASPWCDVNCKGESYTNNSMNDIMFGSINNEVLPNPYKEIDKYLNPLDFNMDDYPPIMINVAKTEMLLSDSLSLYDKLDKEKSELHLYPLMWHDFYTHNDTIPECHDCWMKIGKFVRKNI